MTLTQSPSYQSTDSEYLEWVMAPLVSSTFPCARCGIPRETKGKRPPELCRTCSALHDDGAAIREPDVDTPCFASTRFWELEAEAERELQPSGRQGRRARLELLAKYEPQVQQEFCGSCPLVEQCLQWGKDEGYTGFAGGRWLKDGKTQDEIDVERGVGSSKSKGNQYTADPHHCRKGHERKVYGFRDKRGYLACRMCRRLQDITRNERKRRKRQEAVAA